MKKNKFQFFYCTTWERRGLILFIILILGSLGFRIFGFHYNRKSNVLLDEKKYALYLAFSERQAFLKDSLQAEREAKSRYYKERYENSQKYSKLFYEKDNNFLKYNNKNITDTGKRNTVKNRWNSNRYISQVDINHADSLDLQSIPGIGAKTAKMIIMYREKLGGFISLEQLLEIDYMDSSRWIRLLPYICLNNNTEIRKININNASIEELKRHPYIDFYLAKSIVVHRNANGGYHSLEEMRKETRLYQELFDKIKPYLCLE